MSRLRGLEALAALKLVLCSSLVAVLLPLDLAARGDERAYGTEGIVDCGTMSLAALLTLEGHPAEPDLLLACLPPTSSAGPSLAELRDAAGTLGFHLRGVRLQRDERAIDRPMIVFLQRAGHGHYQVVRPVGHTGKLAQVIDPNWPPYIVDKSALLAAPEWTGIVLIPDRWPGWPTRVAWGLAGGAIAAVVIWIATLLPRRVVRGSSHQDQERASTLYLNQ